MEVDGGVIKEVEQFCYLGDILDCEAGVERAVRARITIAWGRWRRISRLLANRSIDLRIRGRVYEACVRSALLYGAETWALGNRLTDILRSCDRRMLRYMAGVRWQDGRSGSEVAEMCGVEELAGELRKRRLRWYGHLKRADGGPLGEIEEIRVEGRRPVGRPKKRWNKYVEEDMNLLGIEEGMAQDRQLWKTVIASRTPR